MDIAHIPCCLLRAVWKWCHQCRYNGPKNRTLWDSRKNLYIQVLMFLYTQSHVLPQRKLCSQEYRMYRCYFFSLDMSFLWQKDRSKSTHPFSDHLLMLIFHVWQKYIIQLLLTLSAENPIAHQKLEHVHLKGGQNSRSVCFSNSLLTLCSRDIGLCLCNMMGGTLWWCCMKLGRWGSHITNTHRI
jgi:hypothetical protein